MNIIDLIHVGFLTRRDQVEKLQHRIWMYLFDKVSETTVIDTFDHKSKFWVKHNRLFRKYIGVSTKQYQDYIDSETTWFNIAESRKQAKSGPLTIKNLKNFGFLRTYKDVNRLYNKLYYYYIWKPYFDRNCLEINKIFVELDKNNLIYKEQ